MTHKEWEKEVRKALIDRDLNQKELADALGLSRQYITMTINGTVQVQRTIDRISKFVGVEAYTARG